ncbi:MAG: Mut7-C RNAse domain-containing protein [Pseudomonadota bacterium]
MAVARFRFYEELNDFLAPDRRKREFDYACARAATVKNAIEALGVPHTEVEVILVNGEPVGFSRILREGDRVSVYPKFEAFDVRPLLQVREAPLRRPRFIADAHLGGLARLLRMLGFDTLFDNGFHDDDIRRLAREDGRIVLSRDKELLKTRDITHGCFVHALKPQEQLREIVERLQLGADARPLTLCLHCNRPLRPIEKAQVAERLPPNVAELHQRFSTCDGCGRVFWEGSHWARMRELLADYLPRAAA